MSQPIEPSALSDGRNVNYWRQDRTIQRIVESLYTDDEFEWARERLDDFGRLVGYTVASNADVIDRHGPQLRTLDRHGALANHVEYHPLQYENEQLVYEAGIVADCFDVPAGREEPMGLYHNLVMQYLLSYADPGFDCPVAMTTGVALVLERFDDGSLREYLDALTSRRYDECIEGAMFLTETQAGSDLGAIETTARYDDEEGSWRLTGEKWFCSNIDAQATLTLARTPDAPQGTAGLSMFLIPHTLPDGRLNEQRYRRLKDKLGTISVPTGEVEFDGAHAFLVGDAERGFKQMAEMLNFERLSNAAASCGIIGRALLESKVKAATHRTFGERLEDHPLMRVDLVDMAVDHEAATAFTFEAASHYAHRERTRRQGEEAPEAYLLMRSLVPVAKARTARMAVDVASYAMEVQGGNGYVNDFVTHRLLRDAQVLPIWEGTENILSLDLLRAFEADEAHTALASNLDDRLAALDHDVIADDVAIVRAEFEHLSAAIDGLTGSPAGAQRVAKRIMNLVFDVVTATVLLEAAVDRMEADGHAREAAVARRFIERMLEDDRTGRIPDGDPLVAEAFDAIVHFEPLDLDRYRDLV